MHDPSHKPTPPATRWTRRRGEVRALLALGAPIVVQNLANMGMQLTDTVLAGRLSPDTLAGVAIGGAIYTPLLTLGMGVLLALTPTLAHLVGEGRMPAGGEYVRQAGWLALAVSLLGMLALWFAGPALPWVGIVPGLAGIATGYLRAICWGLPGMTLFLVLRFTSEGLGHTRPLLAVALLGLAVNAVADYAFIYGRFGLPQLGAVGCGLASASVMWLMGLVLLAYVRRTRHYRPLAIFDAFSRPRADLLRELFFLGFPIGIAIFMEVSLFGALSLVMGALGTDAVAAHQIAVNFSGTLFMVPLGLSMAASVRVGQAMGRRSAVEVKRASRVAIGVCTLINAVFALLLWFGRGPVAALYTPDAGVQALAAALLGMSAVFQLSDGMQVAGAGVLRGMKDTQVPMWITVLAYWGIGFPAAWWLGLAQGYGPRAVWVGLIAGLSVAAILLNWRVWRQTRSLSARWAHVGNKER